MGERGFVLVGAFLEGAIFPSFGTPFEVFLTGELHLCTLRNSNETKTHEQ
jgi:hypothetical protein